MAHGNAKLTVRARFELVRQVEGGWPQTEVARQFRVSRSTVAKWLRRYREEGVPGLEDRSSVPRRNPRLTPPDQARLICAIRRANNWGPHRIGWLLRIPRSTVYAVLRRAGLHRLAWLHRTTRRV
ncbi:MAG: helix-turn-helix domain-containing protein, partial [Gemmatimonadetes bacterium]|nr:helix-turn-helix domain-containing protein [Gemmatimonadota bacterium]